MYNWKFQDIPFPLPQHLCSNKKWKQFGGIIFLITKRRSKKTKLELKLEVSPQGHSNLLPSLYNISPLDLFLTNNVYINICKDVSTLGDLCHKKNYNSRETKDWLVSLLSISRLWPSIPPHQIPKGNHEPQRKTQVNSSGKYLP